MRAGGEKVKPYLFSGGKIMVASRGMKKAHSFKLCEDTKKRKIHKVSMKFLHSLYEIFIEKYYNSIYNTALAGVLTHAPLEERKL